jgi:signal transduction histidine kinase/iron only hydrogenase large subunit-like protein
MRNERHIPLVTTIKERCRVCYTCVRECPSKAIRIADGQAEVLPERCVGCGNCVRVCSQQAKRVFPGVPDVRDLLAGPKKVAACIAPSFPAEFSDVDHPRLVGMIKALGFDQVTEVAFGADLVAKAYHDLLENHPDKKYIATSCPAIIAYVERYQPDLTQYLAPIVSPMVAMARALRHLHGDELQVVFIGPCIAKKGEAASTKIPGEIQAVLTFVELREMLRQEGVTAETVEASDFDPPHPGSGALFPISRGLLQAADIKEDLISGEIVAADGQTKFVQALKDFESGTMDVRLLEVLCCNGCIMGAGMSCDDALFARRSRISQYVRQRIREKADAGWGTDGKDFARVDLSRTYEPYDQRIPVPFEEEIRMILARMGKYESQDELNCGACGYPSCREHAVAIFKGMAESEMCLPYTIERLRRTVEELGDRNLQLASTQEALMHSERLASMGQLAAGIAHEVNNPLGVVLMYAHLLRDQQEQDSELNEDLRMIAEQADRCKKIVAGLLDFARQNKVVLEEEDLLDIVEQSAKAVPKPDGVELDIQTQTQNTAAEVDRDQLQQVFTNLLSNAYAAMDGQGRMRVRLCGDAENLRLEFADTGCGISKDNQAKIFEPFFTTKQIGKGTGLGLAVTYGIIKMHRGDIRVESNDDPQAGETGTTFIVSLPRRGQQKPQGETDYGEDTLGG